VDAVNTPSSDFTMMIVNNGFRFPSGVEVTTSMALPFDAGDGPPTFYFNIEAFAAYRAAADDFIRTELGGMDPLNPAAMLINEITEAEKVHEFRTTGRVTVVPRDARNEIDALRRTQVRFRGDPNSETDRRRAQRGMPVDGGWDGGYGDEVSTEAEGAFRTAAGLPARAESTARFREGFHEWPDRTSEADGALFVAVRTPRGRFEMVIYHGADGSFLRLDTGAGAAGRFEREAQRRAGGGGR
jgi:hypothetical protein